MDISLIEEKMEESIKHIYELNSVVRMSLIEMQFMRKVRDVQSNHFERLLPWVQMTNKHFFVLPFQKELLSALVAMDELMGSNEMNMQLAAMVSCNSEDIHCIWLD